ncbi:MAG: hypothetical protein ACTHNM_07825 [Dyella sp.]|uniref:hypothetical protein n=1 Tax=Dyella sp. TaxID=1869338 RepID=UPI003F81B0B9
MSDEIVVHADTRTVLEEVFESIAERTGYWRHHPYYRPVRNATSINQLRRQLLRANDLVAEYELRNERPIFGSENMDDWSWLTYIVDIDVIPIYEDGVTVSTRKLIAKPQEIPQLVRFITVTGANAGLDVENHNFGYHFHFGSIKRNKLQRTNLLLTFKPTDAQSPGVPLYAEQHGTYPSISVATIGINKRIPIYHVCHAEMAKRGIQNFKRPAKGSNIFFP